MIGPVFIALALVWLGWQLRGAWPDRRGMPAAAALERLRALEVPTVRRMPEPPSRDVERYKLFRWGEYRAARLGWEALPRLRDESGHAPPWPQASLRREERRRLRANGINRRGCS